MRRFIHEIDPRHRGEPRIGKVGSAVIGALIATNSAFAVGFVQAEGRAGELQRAAKAITDYLAHDDYEYVQSLDIDVRKNAFTFLIRDLDNYLRCEGKYDYTDHTIMNIGSIACEVAGAAQTITEKILST